MTESAGRARLIEHWSVAVNRNGENILTIESNCLSGKDLTLEDQETIRQCARHLVAFVGAAEALAGQEEAPHLDEEVPHPFNSRTPYEPEDERDIWCKDCEHHRDARIHASAKAEEHAPAPPRPKPDIAALKALPDEF
jgi:hypothetical protein